MFKIHTSLSNMPKAEMFFCYTPSKPGFLCSFTWFTPCAIGSEVCVRGKKWVRHAGTSSASPRFTLPIVLCVSAEENEFILYAMRKSIHRYDLASGATEQLPLTGLRAAVALDFDYEHNCLYWSDLALDIIQVSQPLV